MRFKPCGREYTQFALTVPDLNAEVFDYALRTSYVKEAGLFAVKNAEEAGSL